MRRLGVKLLSSAGARVVALIAFATLPVAAVSAVLAWHGYRNTVSGGFDRGQADLFFARSLVINEVFRARDAVETLANRIETVGLDNVSSRNIYNPLGNMCRLALFDAHGDFVKGFKTPHVPAPGCSPQDLIVRNGTWRATSDKGEMRVIPYISVVNNRLYIRIALKMTFVTAGKGPVEGLLEGIKFFPMQAALAYSHDIRGDSGRELDDIWLLTRGAPPMPLVIDRDQPVTWSNYARSRIKFDEAHKVELDHFKEGNLSYSFAPVFEGSSLVSVTRLRPSETHALDLFLARVAFIVFLLIIELALVALAAHFFLVSPLQKLAEAVNQWRRTGRFNPSLQNRTPSEISQMSRAFERATRTLDRHEADIKRAMREQDVLIKEIHHRVKNNLQIVASLLSLQARRINQPEARREFQEVRERVRALATLHRHLYPDGGAAILELDAFLGELARQLYAVYAGELMGRIELALDLEKVTVSAEQAVPIALIVTELMTNALTHGFPDERSGVVRLHLRQEAGHCTLIIQDNGVGFDPDEPASPDRREGLGQKLVAGFVTQLGAEMERELRNGSKYIITFDVKPVKRIVV